MRTNLYCRLPADWLNDPSLCWFEWQALVAGLSALAVGAATIWLIRRQINQQDGLHRQNRSSRFAVAKAKSPFAAIEVAEHARLHLEAALELLVLVEGRDGEPFLFKGPAFPCKAENILDGLVESTDDPILIDQVSALYSEHQVMASRMADIRRPSEHAMAIDDYILQPIMMDAIAMNLLEFGRDEKRVERLSWSDVEGSAKRLIKREPVRKRILDYIAVKKQRNKPVPLALRRHNG